MYATLRQANIQQGAAAEIARRMDQELVPMLGSLDGFQSFHLIDMGTALATITVFATQAAAEQANQQAAAWAKANIADLIAGPLELRIGEVLLQR